MDSKERFLVDQARMALESGTFSERDVLNLLILLRQHAPPNSLMLEFGDFIAHREKDRGILSKYITKVQSALMATESDDKAETIPVITAEQIVRSINELLRDALQKPVQRTRNKDLVRPGA